MNDENKISPAFKAAVEQLGGPQGLHIISDLKDTLLEFEGYPPIPVMRSQGYYLGLLWALQNGATVQVASTAIEEMSREHMLTAGASDPALLESVIKKPPGLWDNLPDAPLLYIDNDELDRSLFTHSVHGHKHPVMTLDPKNL